MPIRESIYDNSLHSGAELKAEIRRASVMARKSMARVNLRKTMASHSQNDILGSQPLGSMSANSIRGSEGDYGFAMERTRSSSASEDFDDADAVPFRPFLSEGGASSKSLGADIEDSPTRDSETMWEQGISISLKTPPRMLSTDDERSMPRGPGQPQKYLSWISMSKVEMVIIVLITFNMYCLALETDNPKWPWWNLVNIAFLALYVAEFSVRALQRGLIFILLHARSGLKYWIWYDLFVILLGVADAFASSQSGGSCRGAEHYVRIADNVNETFCADAPLVRFLMLCRLLRAVRIVRMISPLYSFVKQLITMIAGTISWILLVIFIFCFVLAIIFTRLLGHGLLTSETKTQDMFKDVPSSLFALFQLTTADDWARIALPVISAHLHPVAQFMWRLFFIFFITFMSWTMLSLLTAVASEEMLTLKSTRKADEELRQELERQGLINFLCDEFERADTDANGVLDRQEFMDLMNTENFRVEMKRHGLSLEERDIGKTWDTFDVDESGVLTIEELVYGFSYLQEGLATKHVASIGYALKRNQIASEKQFNDLEAEFDLIEDAAEKMLTLLDKQQDVNKHQWNHFLANQSRESHEVLINKTKIL